MAKRYIAIKRAQLKGVQMMSMPPTLISPVNIGGFLGATEALKRKVEQRWTLRSLTLRLLPIWHDHQYLGHEYVKSLHSKASETDQNKAQGSSIQKIQFWERAGANREISNSGSKRLDSLALEPVAEANQIVSFIFEVEGDDVDDLDAAGIQDLMMSTRWASGTLESHSGIRLFDQSYEAVTFVGHGFSVIDRTLDLEMTQALYGAKTRLDQMIAALGLGLPQSYPDPSKEKEDEKPSKAWIVPFNAGYQLLEAPKQRTRSRFQHSHAYAENLIGIAEFVGIKRIPQEQLKFWQIKSQDHQILFC